MFTELRFRPGPTRTAEAARRQCRGATRLREPRPYIPAALLLEAERIRLEPPPGAADTEPALRFTEAELARACAAAAVAAAAATRREAAEAAERTRATTLLACLDAIREGEEAVTEELTRSIGRLALLAAEVLPTAGDRRLLAAGLTSLIAEALPELLEQPVLALCAEPATLAILQDELATAAEAAGFRGSLRLESDDRLPGSVVRIAWDCGWAEADLGRAAGLLGEWLTAAATARPAGRSVAPIAREGMS